MVFVWGITIMRIKTQNRQSVALLFFFFLQLCFDFTLLLRKKNKKNPDPVYLELTTPLKQFSIFWGAVSVKYSSNIFPRFTKQEGEWGREIRLDDDWNGLIYICAMHTLHTWSLHSAGSSGQKSTICMRWTHLYANSLACTDLLHFFHSGLFTY